MNDLELLRVFCVAAEAANFREAAATLGVSPQVVTRSVRALEERLGEALFHRNTRQVRITTFGEQLAGQGRELVASMEAMLRPKSARREAQVSGVVRVAAPEALGRSLVMQALAPVLTQHPTLTLDLRLSEALTNAVDQRIDVGVRIGTLRDSRFVARSVAKIAFHVVATPALLKRTGTPTTPADVQTRPMIALVDRNSGRPWPWQFLDSKSFTPTPAFITDDLEAEREAALMGLGFAQLPNYLACRHLASGQLVEVLASHAPTPWPVSVYRVSQSPVPPRVKLVFDQLVQALSEAESFR
jgi:DNA-binding transcriptional LysR family regulator